MGRGNRINRASHSREDTDNRKRQYQHQQGANPFRIRQESSDWLMGGVRVNAWAN